MTFIRLDLDRPSVTTFAKVFSKVLRLYKLFAGSGAEQVVFALQNFVFTVLAARLTTTEQFARFVTEVAIVLLCFLLSSSLVNTPALVLLHKRYSSRKIEYLNSLRIFASLLGVLAPLLFIPILFLVGIKLDFVTLGGMAALHYSMLSYDLQRRWANVTDKLKALFLQTTIASVFALITATLMAEYRVLSDSTIQFAFAIPFIIISWCSWLRGSWTIGYTNSLSKLRDILVDHWIFAWALIISNFLHHWISTQGYFLVAAKLLSATDLGGLRTTQSLCSVLNIAFIVFENRILH